MARLPGRVHQRAADGLHWVPPKLRSQRDDLHCLCDTRDRIDEALRAVVTSLIPSMEVYAKAALERTLRVSWKVTVPGP
jgi:hypothetical protein